MLRLLAIGIDTAASALVLFPMILILRRAVFKSYAALETLLILAFAAALSAVFSATGIPSFNELRFDPAFQWIPLAGVLSDTAAYVKNTALNILLFIPVGLLLALTWRRFEPLKNVALFGFGLSLCIEFLQIFTFRLTDIDDVIFNTAGAVIGGLIAPHMKKPPRPEPASHAWLAAERYEPFLVTAAAGLAAFFVQPYIADGFWAVLLP